MFSATIGYLDTPYRCQLMRLMSRTILTDDYHYDCGTYWIFERLDEISRVLGIKDDYYDNELQRISVASILERIYTPFASYLINETNAYERLKHDRYRAVIYWYCLHRILCSHEKLNDKIDKETIQRFVCYVEDFVEYLRQKKLECCPNDEDDDYVREANRDFDIFSYLFPDLCREAYFKYYEDDPDEEELKKRYPSKIRKYSNEWFETFSGS
jgi:hypothetical protein